MSAGKPKKPKSKAPVAHDPLCGVADPARDRLSDSECSCRLIAQIRQDERKRRHKSSKSSKSSRKRPPEPPLGSIVECDGCGSRWHRVGARWVAESLPWAEKARWSTWRKLTKDDDCGTYRLVFAHEDREAH